MTKLEDWLEIRDRMKKMNQIVLKAERRKALDELGGMLRTYMQNYNEKFCYHTKPTEDQNAGENNY